MSKIFEIATNISTPLMLAGFIAAAFFLIVRQILKKDLFPTLTRQLSADIIKLVIERLFILSLIAMVLGFFGFVLTTFVKSNQGISFTMPKLTPDQQQNYDFHMEAATWCREHNRPRQALEHYRNAREIVGDHPEILAAINALQKQLDQK